MCGGGAQKVKSETKLPWYQEATGKTLYERGSKEATTPFQAYQGTRVAPTNADQETAWRMTSQNAGSWNPLFSGAQQFTTQGGQSWIDPGVMQSYIDPFQSAVTGRAAGELERQFGINEKLRRGRAAETGSWGGSQAGVGDAMAERDFMQQLEDVYSTGAEKAYQSGLQAFQGDRSAKQQTGGAYASLAQLLPSLQQQDVAGIEAAGNARQAQHQGQLDQAYSDFAEGRDWNKNQLSWLAGLMNQAPAPVSTTQTGGGPNTAGQVIGGAQTLGSLALMAKMAGLFGPAAVASDRRLKTDIEDLGSDDTGLTVYRFRYIDGDDEFLGYMADEVRAVAPWAVFRIGGFDAVDYGAI